MKKLWKRVCSFLLVPVMLLSVIPPTAFAAAPEARASYFDFDASDYCVREGDNALTVKIVRRGDGAAPANVAVKVADFLSVYGEDYEVLIGGEALSAQEGAVIDPSEFTFDGGEAVAEVPDAATEEPEMPELPEAATEEPETPELPEAATEEPEPVAEEVPDTVTDEVETTEAVAEEPETPELPEAATEEPDTVADEAEETTDTATDVQEAAFAQSDSNAVSESDSAAAKRSKRYASPLREMQAVSLQLSETSHVDRVTENAESLFENFHDFFDSAQGAVGIVYFGAGVRERELTVRPIDNDEADGSRMFLIGLMGTDTPETTVAVNAAVYVTIEDDDAYEPATFSFAGGNITLTRDAPSAKVTITRTGGTQYFSTAYVSTVSDTAKVGAYEQFSLKKVGFAPGQTSAEVTVTASDFSQAGKFGLRLEADEVDRVANHKACPIPTRMGWALSMR